MILMITRRTIIRQAFGEFPAYLAKESENDSFAAAGLQAPPIRICCLVVSLSVYQPLAFLLTFDLPFTLCLAP